MKPGPDRARPRTWFRAAALAIALSNARPAPVAAAEPRIDIATVDLESLLDLAVESVALREEHASEAAASVFVISREEILRQGFRTLEEALRTVPGLFGYADGLYPMIGVRGMGLLGDYTTRLLVLVDGHPLNNSVALGQSDLGRDLPVPLAAVRRIEVIKGPVGSLYGPTAFLGLVNLVTGAGSAAVEGSARGEAAQGAVRAGEADVVGAGASWLASAGAYGSRGQDQRYPGYAATDPGGGLVKGLDHSAATQGYGRLTWRELTASAACGQLERGIPSAPYSSLLRDHRNRLENRSCFVQLGVVHPLTPALTLQARAAYDDDLYRDAFAYAPPSTPGGIFRDRGSDRWLSADLRATWSPWRGTHLVGGASGESHQTLQATEPDQAAVASGVAPVSIGRRYRTLNAYLLAEQEVAAGLTLHGGLTFYSHEIFGSRLTPKVAAVWQPGGSDTLKLVYSEGFRTPTASEALFQDGTTYLANPALRPETVRSLELAWEHRLARVLAVSASLFQNRFHDLIGFVSVLRPGAPVPPLPSDYREEAENLGALRVRGGELGLRLTWREWLQGWAGVAIQSVDQANRPNFPGLTASFALSTRAPWRPLTLSVNGAIVSTRRTDLAAMGGNGPRSVPLSTLLDVAASLEVPSVPGLTLELGIQNLLDVRAPDPVPGDFAPVTTMAQPARTLRAGARFRY